jgi:formylglycine-generating enzyme required for sulfatase activity
MPQQIFISYASADKPIAERVCGALESAGLTCWIAPRNITPGVDYPSAIVDAIASARAFVLILTEHAAASPHILSEVGHAFNGKKRIIPFRISQAPLPEDLEYFLSLTQWLDVPDGCTSENLKRLIDASSAALAGERVGYPAAGVRSGPTWRVPTLLALLVVGGIIVWLKLRSSPRPIPAVVKVPPVETQPATLSPKVRLNPADGLNYVWVPPGEFMMGCSAQDSECKDDEKPAHPVTIDQGFWLGQTEVTIAAYKKFAVKHSLSSPSGDGTLPMSGESWMEAKQYCKVTGGRLPTEAEWEYAARAGSPLPYYGAISQIAWYASNSKGVPHPVAQKKPNAFGLYDMLGNVAEWVLDRYFDKYDLDSAATGPTVEEPLSPNALAVARGGYWESDAEGLRVSHRLPQEKEGDQISIGFRCASNQP